MGPMMGHIDWLLELALVALLGLTMVHAIRLERAIKTLRHDRTAFGEAIAGFDASTRQAEASFAKLQGIASEAAQLVNRRVQQASALKDDLAYLSERGETLADRLDSLVRTGRGLASAPSAAPATEQVPTHFPSPEPPPKVRSQAERDLLMALRGVQ
ncbi:MAG: hypothetical protein NVS2B9_12860 [Myxococcales bacterium]